MKDASMQILISTIIMQMSLNGDLNNVHGFMLVHNDITITQVVNFNQQVMKYQVM